MLDDLQTALKKYTRIILIAQLSQQGQLNWNRFCAILPSVSEEASGHLFWVEEGIPCPEGVTFQTISHEMTRDLRELYLTYEFSDRFTLFPDSTQYGTVFNYVNIGILTMEEAVKAILY